MQMAKQPFQLGKLCTSALSWPVLHSPANLEKRLVHRDLHVANIFWGVAQQAAALCCRSKAGATH